MATNLPPDIQVALISYKGVHEQTLLMYMGLVEAFLRRGGGNIVPIWNDALICRSRSRVVSGLLPDLIGAGDQRGGDVMVFLDHDVEVSPEDVLKLGEMAVEQDAIIGIPYALRDPLRRRWAGRIEGGKMPCVGQDVVIDAHLIPTLMAVPARALRQIWGACSISRDPALKVTRCKDNAVPGWTHFVDFFRPMPVQSPEGDWEYLSEEWAFCHRARAAGVPVRLWLKPTVRHHGSYPYTMPEVPPATEAKP
jgi:hypothetical protein